MVAFSSLRWKGLGFMDIKYHKENVFDFKLKAWELKPEPPAPRNRHERRVQQAMDRVERKKGKG